MGMAEGGRSLPGAGTCDRDNEWWKKERKVSADSEVLGPRHSQKGPHGASSGRT